MKMGIERVLREKWPGLGEVVDVATLEGDPERPVESLSTAVVDKALEQILPAIQGLGGSIQVLSAEAAKVGLE